MTSNHKDEPKTAPQPDRWYNLTLGSSFKDHNSPSKFCTLRYEFKPASIDKNQTGSLHKTKDNRVTVGFQNNQPGKPKVNFEGTSEDYKENDAVLLFDGGTLRLERLHRAVKRLRHVRLPGESVAAAPVVTSFAQTAVESSPPPMSKVAKFQSLNKSVPQLIPVEVERIEIGNFNSSAPSDAKPKNEKATTTTTTDYQSAQYNNILPEGSPDDNKHDDLDEQLDILNDDDEEEEDANRGNFDYGMKEFVSGIDINQPNGNGNGNDTDEEIADVDVSDDEEDKGRNAAEELRAQVNNAANKEKEEQSSSSSGSSGSGSSGSGSSRSGSSSSDSESSDDSVNSI